MLLAVLIAWVALPHFNRLTQKQIRFTEIPDSGLLLWLAGIFLANMLCAALYPAWQLARLTPVATLYLRQSLSARNTAGNFLMVFQFATAILLGIASLGYNPAQVVQIHVGGVRDVRGICDRFRHELDGDPAVRAISLTGDFGYRDVTVNGLKFQSHVRTIDAHYLTMLEMKLRAGRNFARHSTFDNRFGVLVNEAFVKTTGVKDPVGKTLMPDPYFGNSELTILGVVGDFHYQSLKERIAPMIMLSSAHYEGGSIWVKIANRNQQATLQKLERTFKKLLPHAFFDYSFLSDSHAQAYAMESKWQQIITIVTLIAVLICSMGLFGLAHLGITQRRRETGIRIALGATGHEIALLFSKSFIRIILLAVVVASPAGHYLMHHWLSNFAYHAGIPWWIFALPGAAAIAIALVTVTLQSLRAAATDPVKALRSE